MEKDELSLPALSLATLYQMCRDALDKFPETANLPVRAYCQHPTKTDSLAHFAIVCVASHPDGTWLLDRESARIAIVGTSGVEAEAAIEKARRKK